MEQNARAEAENAVNKRRWQRWLDSVANGYELAERHANADSMSTVNFYQKKPMNVNWFAAASLSLSVSLSLSFYQRLVIQFSQWHTKKSYPVVCQK